MEGNENVNNKTGGQTGFEKEAGRNWRAVRSDRNVPEESGVVRGEERSREFSPTHTTSHSEIEEISAELSGR